MDTDSEATQHNVANVLGRLEIELRRVGAPISASLRPGLTPAAIQHLTRDLPFRLGDSLAALYGWHDGSEGNGPGEELFPGARFPNLERSVEAYFFEMRLAKEVASEYGFAPLFADDWFPVFVTVGGDWYVATRAGNGPVIELNRVEPERNQEEAGSLPALYQQLVERYRVGAYSRGSERHLTVNEGLLARLNRAARRKGPDVDHLIAELQDPSSMYRATQEIVRFKFPEMVEPLIGLLSNTDSAVRREAALLLGAIADVRAIPHLVRALGEWEGKDLSSAWGGLQTIGPQGVIGHLEAALRDGDPQLRMLAARALGKSQDATAVPALHAATHDPEPRVREAAQGALRRLHAP
jgi:HEAT repeats